MACTIALGFTSCREKKAKDKVKDRVENVKESVEDALEEAQEQIEEGADDVRKALDEAGDEIEKAKDLSNVYNTSIKVGQFSSHNICPTCGLATSSFVIGELDDVRYFDHPDHFNADIMWFTKGYVEYVIPNLIPRNQKITQLSLSAEISSEAPGIDNDWPSDISFYINDTLVGTWTSPGDYGDVRGMFTPEWWPQNWNQYGLLKLLVINHKGTFIDGLKISDITTSELTLDYTSTIRFRIAVEEDSAHVGGLTIFGKSFGNYDQDIVVSINYAPLDTEKNTK